LIYIIVKQASKRFVYTCEVIFKQVLKLDYRFYEINHFQLLDESKKPGNNDVIINYGITDLNRKSLNIYNFGLLFNDDLTEMYPDSAQCKDSLKLFPAPTHNYDIDFDVFSASFYLLTEYYHYFNPKYDKHQRYDESSFTCYFSKPWVNIWANVLLEKIKIKYPEFQLPVKSFSFDFTFDVDHPFAFNNRGIPGKLAFFNDLLRADFKNFNDRLTSQISRRDPYNTFDFIFQQIVGQKARFFILASQFSKYDSRVSISKKAYADIIRGIVNCGYEIGIHPSYYSFINKQIIRYEKEYLEKTAKVSIISARQHYLKYSLPSTRQYYTESGIVNDFNSVCISNTGFKNAISNAFTWFDLTKNLMTNLTIHPSAIMDVSLNIYQKMKVEQAYDEIVAKIALTDKYGGNFSMLWHNNSLSEIHGWQGWRELFISVNKLLQSKKTI